MVGLFSQCNAIQDKLLDTNNSQISIIKDRPHLKVGREGRLISSLYNWNASKSYSTQIIFFILVVVRDTKSIISQVPILTLWHKQLLVGRELQDFRYLNWPLSLGGGGQISLSFPVSHEGSC